MKKYKYLEVKKNIEELAMLTGPSQRLPGVRELMAEFGVSQATISKALSELEQEGIIVRKWGAGIMAAPKTQTTTVIRKKKDYIEKPRKILFSYASYYSGGLWSTLDAFEMYCVQRNTDVTFHKHSQDFNLTDFVAHAREQKKIAGIVLGTSSSRLTDQELELLGTLPFKVVLFWSNFRYAELPENVYCVGFNVEQAAGLMGQYLIENGHRRVGFVYHSPKTDYNEVYLKMLTASIKESGGKIDVVFRGGTHPWEDSLLAAEKTVRDNILAIKENKLTALVFSSSDGALAAIRPLRESGLRVPEDISIAGSGNMPLYNYLPDVPAVTAVPLPKIVRPAVDFLLSRKKYEKQEKLVELELIKYNGVANIKQS